MSGWQFFLFEVFPYVALTSFVVGLVWRYRYDKFGWTSRSSQWYESRTLRWASPMFHFGILGVLAGHFIGLVIPATWTESIGVSEDAYHLVAMVAGGIFGVMTVVGLVALVSRRRLTRSVFRATTVNDKVMYLVLGAVILLGMVNTIGVQLLGGGFDYRDTVAVWFRSIFWFRPEGDELALAPWSFQAHAVMAFLLVAIWPFTRLVHVLSAPVGYLVRPYVVYRTRDPQPQPSGYASR
ncbi:MAG: respiratory nitrate reductase subunit gamma [Candidatus Nanopelagicales bacterium]